MLIFLLTLDCEVYRVSAARRVLPKSSGGIDIGQLFQNATNGLSQDGQALQAKMDQISASGEVDQMQLLELQFAMGQYNAKLETISSVTKSIQDMLKSLAQRTG